MLHKWPFPESFAHELKLQNMLMHHIWLLKLQNVFKWSHTSSAISWLYIANLTCSTCAVTLACVTSFVIGCHHILVLYLIPNIRLMITSQIFFSHKILDLLDILESVLIHYTSIYWSMDLISDLSGWYNTHSWSEFLYINHSLSYKLEGLLVYWASFISSSYEA